MATDRAPRTITFDELSVLRGKTERLSAFLTERLKNHLAALYPVLAPKRVFGKYLGSKESAARAEEAYTQLAEKFRAASGAPFDLRSDLDDEALSAMEFGIEAYPWEYTHEIEGKRIIITSPVRWAVSYRSDYSLAQMRAMMSGKTDRRTVLVRHFLANALGIQVVFGRNPGAVQMLGDLRYNVRTETGPGLGKLPLLTISSFIPSFRPPDELLLAATRLSGVPAFIELVDEEAARRWEDPLRSQIEAILNT